jgi:hypothetical protein
MRSNSNLRGKKSLSMPTIRQDIRVSKPRVVESRKSSIDMDRRSIKNIQRL